ncbi:MAG: PRC-barrel domain-containing protein, partial [Nocardioidaceae bacterium]
MSTPDQMGRIVGQNVYAGDGKKIGTASNLYTSDASRTPEWVTVRTGLFGKKDSFVPLAGARTDESGLHVSARKDTVKDAPRVEDDGSIDEQDATDLYRYYGIQTGKHERDSNAAGETGTSAPAAGTGTAQASG